jgi:hypothetical protein
MGSMSN